MYKTKVLVEQIFDELPRPCEVFILWTGYSSGLDSTSKKKNSEKEPVPNWSQSSLRVLFCRSAFVIVAPSRMGVPIGFLFFSPPVLAV